MTPQPRELTDDDVDAMLVPVRDIVPLIAKAVRGRDEEILALRRIVAEQEALIQRLADDVAPDDDARALH